MRGGALLLRAGRILMVGGAAVLALHYCGVIQSHTAQKNAKEWLNAREAARPASPAGPATPRDTHAIRRGDVWGELNIPRLHVSVMVFEGDDAGILKIGAGHIRGTGMADGDGNIGIAAHRDTFFRPLRAIHANDIIILRTPSGTSRFAVTETEIVRPSQVEVLAPAPGRNLTLVTCYPFVYAGHAPRRFIVHAKKIG